MRLVRLFLLFAWNEALQCGPSDEDRAFMKAEILQCDALALGKLMQVSVTQFKYK